MDDASLQEILADPARYKEPGLAEESKVRAYETADDFWDLVKSRKDMIPGNPKRRKFRKQYLRLGLSTQLEVHDILNLAGHKRRVSAGELDMLQKRFRPAGIDKGSFAKLVFTFKHNDISQLLKAAQGEDTRAFKKHCRRIARDYRKSHPDHMLVRGDHVRLALRHFMAKGYSEATAKSKILQLQRDELGQLYTSLINNGDGAEISDAVTARQEIAEQHAQEDNLSETRMVSFHGSRRKRARLRKKSIRGSKVFSVTAGSSSSLQNLVDDGSLTPHDPLFSGTPPPTIMKLNGTSAGTESMQAIRIDTNSAVNFPKPPFGKGVVGASGSHRDGGHVDAESNASAPLMTDLNSDGVPRGEVALVIRESSHQRLSRKRHRNSSGEMQTPKRRKRRRSEQSSSHHRMPNDSMNVDRITNVSDLGSDPVETQVQDVDKLRSERSAARPETKSPIKNESAMSPPPPDDVRKGRFDSVITDPGATTLPADTVALILSPEHFDSLVVERINASPSNELTADTKSPQAATPRNKNPTTSPYFVSTPPSKKKTRSPGGTVSCLPFAPLSAKTFGLVQEQYADNPYLLLIAVKFLNRTAGRHALPIFFEIIEKYPTPSHMAAAIPEEVIDIVRILGLQQSRTKQLIRMAQQWLKQPPKFGVRHRTLGYPQE